MEFSFLYAIPRTAVLDSFFLAVTNIAGSYGQLWVIVAAVLLIFKSTRKAGVAVLLAYVMVFLVGQYGLKNLISRPRPCQIDLDFTLLVSRPSSSSFPSTHSAWAFGAATALFMRHKKLGVAAFIAAALIAFSRLYLFLHFPTDVLAGIALGIALGVLANWITGLIWKMAGINDKAAPVA
ncbi:MAG: phosphatase PAP2 family protein [Clostridia bacterium]|nr:phosphatase PAP2 family protein [Clostridia bacterium]MBR6187304.1 phosphatase PAP2 family protein [Clostridia bacterium]